MGCPPAGGPSPSSFHDVPAGAGITQRPLFQPLCPENPGVVRPCASGRAPAGPRARCFLVARRGERLLLRCAQETALRGCGMLGEFGSQGSRPSCPGGRTASGGQQDCRTGRGPVAERPRQVSPGAHGALGLPSSAWSSGSPAHAFTTKASPAHPGFCLSTPQATVCLREHPRPKPLLAYQWRREQMLFSSVSGRERHYTPCPQPAQTPVHMSQSSGGWRPTCHGPPALSMHACSRWKQPAEHGHDSTVTMLCRQRRVRTRTGFGAQSRGATAGRGVGTGACAVHCVAPCGVHAQREKRT